MSDFRRFSSSEATNSILRLRDIQDGLNLYCGGIEDGELDFTNLPQVTSTLNRMLTGHSGPDETIRLLRDEDERQLRIWRGEHETQGNAVSSDTSRLEQLEREIESHSRQRAHDEAKQLESLERAEARKAHRKHELDSLDARIAAYDGELRDLTHRLHDLEAERAATPAEDPLVTKLKYRLDRIDRRIRKWRGIQRDIADDLVRIREALVSGPVATYTSISEDLDQVRRQLFRLEQSAESLVSATHLRTSELRGNSRAELEGELERFKEHLEDAYSGLHHVHVSTSKQLSELERERIEWNMRSMRRYHREIGRSVQKLLVRRSELLNRLAEICPDQKWVLEKAQNGHCHCINAESEFEPCHAAHRLRELDQAITETKEKSYRIGYERDAQLRERDRIERELTEAERECQRLRNAIGSTHAQRLSDLEHQAAELREHLRHGRARLAELAQMIANLESRRKAWLHHRLDDAATHLSKLTHGTYRRMIARPTPFRVCVQDSQGQEFEINSLPMIDRDLANLSLAVALLDDWKTSDSCVVWNVALDRLRLDQAVAVAELACDLCPAELTLVVTTLLTGVANRLHERGFHVVESEAPPILAPSSPVAPVEERLPTSRKIVLRSNNTDAEEFPGEFRDQVVREAPTTRVSESVHHEDLIEAYDSATRQLDLLARELNSEQEWRSRKADANENRRSYVDRQTNSRQLLARSGETPGLHRQQPDRTPPAPIEPSRSLEWVEENSRLRDLEAIPHHEINKLESEGVFLVRDLLAWRASELSQRIDAAELPAARIREWKRYCRLRLQIRKLGRFDAAVLAACEVEDADMLKQLEGYELADRIERLRRTNAGQRLMRTGNDEELSKLNAWVLNMRESRRLQKFGYHDDEAPIHVSRTHASPADEYSSEADDGNGMAEPGTNGNGANGNGKTVASHHTSSNESGSQHKAWSRVSPRESSPIERKTPTVSSKRSSSRSASTKRSAKRNSGGDEKLKFYLNLEDQVEAAPSIGPRMAEHLATINVISIRDLLERDAEEIADALDNSRAKKATVEAWQKQAAFVCRVPNLRGHDAQLLVACDIDSPEELAACEPNALFEIVGPFAQTREGTKIIRAGKSPDLAEITDWIRWSQHQRALQAA